jgi:hypothetical protein
MLLLQHYIDYIMKIYELTREGHISGYGFGYTCDWSLSHLSHIVMVRYNNELMRWMRYVASGTTRLSLVTAATPRRTGMSHVYT